MKPCGRRQPALRVLAVAATLAALTALAPAAAAAATAAAATQGSALYSATPPLDFSPGLATAPEPSPRPAAEASLDALADLLRSGMIRIKGCWVLYESKGCSQWIRRRSRRR
jgi:hypothetical protein